MKASIEWLEEYSDMDVSATELGDILTLTGSKVEGIVEKGKDINKVVVGKILEIEKHPDADKLVVTKVDIGTEILQIVTGANNIKVGDIVPIAKDGAELPDGKKIKTGQLRGIDSCGMMCSVGELGLDISNYPGQIEHGIMILSKEKEKDLGKDIVEILNLREDIIEFEITPNRPDCLSIEGLGRETAASLKKEFKNPHKKLAEIPLKKVDSIEGLKVAITAPDLCYRYVARVVKNVKIGPSPEWMVRRLNACDVRSINNIVDITNYVMLELGQPMHAFDIESIEGKSITVRRAEEKEKITTLDGVERSLDNTMLVIADEKKPVAIAGVMGGENSEIEENTKTIVFESAVFYGGNVRKTAKKVGLRTEASSRFEKGLSSENALRAINRAVELVEMLEAGEPINEVIDEYPTKQQERSIKLDVDRINHLLGITVSKDEMIEILKRLDISVKEDKVIPPFYREDMEGIADVAEEIIRFYGYDKLPVTLINAESTSGGKNKRQKLEDMVRNLLVDRGVSEIYTYGFMNEKDLEKVGITSENPIFEKIIRISNPLSEDYLFMRPTTIPSMMQVITTNYNKKNKEVKLFDLGRIYYDGNGRIENKEVPIEDNILTIGMYGENTDFYEMKGMVESILEICNIPRYEVQKANQISYHPGRTAEVKIGNDTIATFGEMHPMVADNYGISQRIYVAEINVDKLTKYAVSSKKYTEIPKYPAVERDIAVILAEEIEVGKIEKLIQKKAKKALESIQLFDIYRDGKIGEGKKSVAYALTFRDKNKTMTDEEINPIMEEIIKALETELGAELRK